MEKQPVEGQGERKGMSEHRKSTLLLIFTIITIIIVGVGVLVVAQFMNQKPVEPVEDPDTVYFFYGDGCPHCENVMPLILRLQQDYPKVNFRILETWKNTTNAELSSTLMMERGRPNSGVPLVIVGPVVLLGDKQIPEYLEGIVINISIEKSGTNWFKR
jgi:thiol-disulfide isomerase/thioredoxin